MRYRAKIDWWIGASLAIAIAVPWILSFTERSRAALLAACVVTLVIFGGLFPQWYETAADALVIRAGLTTRRIPYGQITAVCATWDSSSSLVLSLDRVRIEYRGRELMIAPCDQEAFFADLAARAPHLSRRGQDLVVSIV